MKRNKIKYDRWLRMLFLSFALLVGGGMTAWGQNYRGPVTNESQRLKIKLLDCDNNVTLDDGSSMHIGHDSVFHEEKVIYVVPGKMRELFIPELRNNKRGGEDERYNWFVHWYVVDKNGKPTTEHNVQLKHKKITIEKAIATLQGGDWTGADNKTTHETQDFFVKDQYGGLVWSKRIRDNIWKGTNDNQLGGYGMDASTVEFQCTDGDFQNVKIYCDVSFYLDGKWGDGGGSDVVATYTEPTLTKRYIFQLHHADEIKDKGIETFEYDYPYSEKDELKTINFTMPYTPDNYFWLVKNEFVQGKKFLYKYEDDDTLLAFRLSTRRNRRIPLQQVQRIVKKSVYQEDKPIVITVFVSDADVEKNETDDNISNKDIDTDEGNVKEVAKFIFNPRTNSGFMLDDQKLKDMLERWPRRNTDRYSMIGHVDFDNNNVVKNDPQKGDNMSAKPFGAFADNWTTYGFLNKNAYTLDYTRQWTPVGSHLSNTSNQNVYGLFRSANRPGVSVGLDLSSAIEGSFQDGSSKIDWKRLYLWPATNTSYAKLPDVSDRVLYDRTAEVSRDSNEKGLPTEFGYFYYIDASNDAGTLVEVPVDKICQNTELTVTAWVADMTRPSYVDADQEARRDMPLAPNINLFFKGVRADGTEKVLHRFTSCDGLTAYQNKGENGKNVNLNLVKWQQLCYSFVITENLGEYTNFHLAIQNNEPHTDGADYAIDDIRIFKTRPQVNLVQVVDPCSETSDKVSFVKFETDYKTLLTNMGLKEGDLTYHKLNLDEKYDPIEEQTMTQLRTYLAEHEEVDLDKFTKIAYMIYDENDLSKPLKIKYDGEHESFYRISYLSTEQKWMEWTGNYTFDEKNPINTITSTTLNIGGVLEVDKNYIVRVYGEDISLLSSEEGTEEFRAVYSISAEVNPCAMTGTFSIPPAKGLLDIKKANTNVEVKSEDMEKGTTYTLTANLVVLDEQLNPDPDSNPKNPIFYWFFGTKEEFEAKTLKLDDGSVISVHDAFTGLGTDTDVQMDDKIRTALDNKYGIWNGYDTFNSDKHRIILDRTEITLTMADGYLPVVIYAPNFQDALKGINNKNRYCSDPKVINLGGTPPTITPGDPDVPDPTDPEYPDNPQPDKDPDTGSYVRSVRVGLVQIQDMLKNQGTLRIPIHFRKSKEGELFVVNTDKAEIKVCSTSDKEREGGLMKQPVVATLVGFGDEYVNIEENGAKPQWDKHFFEIKFNENVVNEFREGFWYMVDIPYAVKDQDKGIVNKGSFKLTLKIVPEYVTWVGSEKEKHNWNNDDLDHWRRSNDEELYTKGVANKNGSHNEAYTPMRFTKVTIHGKATSDKTVGTAYAAYPHLYKLEKNTGDLAKDPNNVLLNMSPDNLSAEIGAATKNIEYDLLADPEFEVELNKKPSKSLSEHSYACVRFYGNTCDEIYVKPESEILHTEYLTYNTARVDYEMAPNRWYMLASPLKGVVSGDMYLPTGVGVGIYARQETPAFDKIEYNNTDYTRWTPAVYMRGWNNGSVKVVYPEGEPAEYAVSANWSNLYNDVDIPFAPGHGFSIGTKTSEFDGNVLFRLPKADTKHSYFSETGTSYGSKHIIPENRAGNGRFFSPDEKGELAVTTTGMFGNPFMSHLDMKKFIERNSENNTYYILNGSTMVANIVNENYRLSTESDYDPNYVAPLQSFIKNDLKNAVFTTDMIIKAPTTPGKKVGLRSATATVSEKTLPQLRITASRGGVHNTALVAGLLTASDSYIEGEDAALLINEEVAAPQVYTLAGNQMTAINVTPELKDIPVGIYGKDDSPVELSFKLSGDMQNVTLVDKQSSKVYPVTDGLTLTVVGNTSGRYFLNGSIATSNEVIARNEIVCYANGDGQIVVSSVDPLTRISVYSVSGQRLRYLDNLNMQTVYVKDLAPGIYIVKAESVTQVCLEKMEVK